ncbi:cell wall hydrolase [Tsuneonella sp. YG55]|uniref:Cell wall hydrolase n=1 Tax=Tsuneonella litorea TaxID=2976475 RepID=A0A9X2W1B8_9SPHN|nr:cell wall hydrolase [Tsuneonella litorea]MCT2559103.1 cell wall hydrolase [Tsuneonella litorea]
MNPTPARHPATARLSPRKPAGDGWRAALGNAIAGPHRGRRLFALAAAVGVPAMAAPGEWRTFDLAADPAEAPVTAMPFERPGESFPGSAFFYLEDLPPLPTGDAPAPLESVVHPGDEPAATGPEGPAARAFTETGTGLDKARALQCMTMALYYEAANEPTEGQRAVAQVILNRVAHPSYPNSVCAVVFQGSERRTGCQFSFTCDGSLERRPARESWNRARRVAMSALGGAVYRPVGLATHYHATYVLPYWAESLANVGTIGLHTFYKWRGAAGAADAFGARYAGREPLPVPHPRSYSDPAGSAPDPVVLAQAYEAARAKAAAVQGAGYLPPAPQVQVPPLAVRGGEPILAAGNLPRASGVRAEYANSGRWIAEPGTITARDVNSR